jgi:hypothetical protein
MATLVLWSLIPLITPTSRSLPWSGWHAKLVEQAQIKAIYQAAKYTVAKWHSVVECQMFGRD